MICTPDSSSAEFIALRKRYRPFFPLLLPALFILSGWAYVAGQEKTPSGKEQSGNETRWSDPATWPDRKVPRTGDAVTIGRDMNVVLDVSPPALRSVTIDGTLRFANSRDLELITEWIRLHGELHIGSEANPHTRKATIT